MRTDTESVTIHGKAFEQHFTVVSVFDFPQFVILENLTILGLALSGVKGFGKIQPINL